MRKKIISLYIVYLALNWIYFVFFYPLETYSDSRYAAYSHAMFFSKLPLPWIFLYFLVKSSYTDRWAGFAERMSKWEWSRTVIFCGILIAVYQAAELPFVIVWHQLALEAGVSHQPLSDWIYELFLSFLVQWAALSIVVYAVRMLMQKFKKYWWLFVWLAIVPLALFYIYLQPVLIDPLYADFTEIDAGPMREAIEAMAEQSGLENADLLKVNMSEETAAYNAYVTGIWGNQRIVLWDTTLAGLEQGEVLFILAHEIGHYVYHHVPLGIAGYLVMGLFLIWLTNFFYQKKENRLSRRKAGDLRTIPALLLIASLLSAALQPAALAVSRQIEKAADNYAIEHTDNPAAGIGAFIEIAEQSKEDINPAFFVELFKYSHPAIQERIDRIQEELE